MNKYFSLFGKLYEKDAVTTVCVLVLIAVVVTAVWLYRKHNKTDNSPDLLDYDGYYKIALTPTGYAPTDRSNLFRTMSTFYYLRKDPFNIEVSIDEIEADNGKKYRAMAVAMVVMPEERIDFVCRRYFDGSGINKAEVITAVMNHRSGPDNSVVDILEAQKAARATGTANADELFRQVISGNASANSRTKHRQEKKTCDGDIDMELTIAFSSSLKKLIKEQAGTMTKEELKKKFLGSAMLEAMTTGHAVMEIPVFNIIEITD